MTFLFPPTEPLRYRFNILNKAVGTGPVRIVGTLLVLAIIFTVTTIFGSPKSNAQESPGVDTSFVTFAGTNSEGHLRPEHQFVAQEGWFYEVNFDLSATLVSISSPAGEQVLGSYGDFSWVAKQSGQYSMSLNPILDQIVTYSIALSGIADDHGNDASSADILEIGRTVSGELFGIDDDDWFVLSTKGGTSTYSS